MAELIFERTIITVGNSTGLTLPPEILTYLQLKDGDTINITPTQNKKQKNITIWKKEK